MLSAEESPWTGASRPHSCQCNAVAPPIKAGTAVKEGRVPPSVQK
jgi:hypothetical protein